VPRARQRQKVETFAPEPLAIPAEVPAVVPEEPRGSLFEDLDDEDGVIASEPAAPMVELPVLDADLTPDEKEEFVKLLREEMPVKDRARQLGILARKTGQKTAAVGLRAIIEINELTGMRKERAAETAPMFQLPAGASVSITVQKVEK